MDFHRDIIVIGASAGGVHALSHLVQGFPSNFSVSVFIVQHTSPASPGLMVEILESRCALPLSYPHDGEPIERGHVYIAPPDHHLVLEEDRVRVTRGPLENRFRPSIDVLFRSAALVFGPRVIGAVLTGYLDDGASGLFAIKERGGLAVVQAPEDAEVPDMPRSALRRVKVDEIVPLSQMAHLFGVLALEPTRGKGGLPVSDTTQKRLEIEVDIAKEENALERGVLEVGQPSHFTCPECHGVLLQIKEGTNTRFRCHTGHAFSLDSLLSEVSQAVEDSLWSSLRAMEETEMLLNHIKTHLSEVSDDEGVVRVEEQVLKLKARQNLVREAVMSQKRLTEENL